MKNDYRPAACLFLTKAAGCRLSGDKSNARRYLACAHRWLMRSKSGCYEL